MNIYRSFQSNKLKLLVFLAGFMALTYNAYAQLDNKAFTEKKHIDTSHKAEHIYLHINSLSFSKNNEYFNNISDGRTFFGFQLNPEFNYYPTRHIKISTGAYLWKDFGNPQFSQIAPVFSVTLQKENAALIFGTLKGSLNHNLIQPLYGFDRIVYDRLENGIQGLYQNKWLSIDTWIDWEKALYRGDSAQEHVFGGLSGAITLLNNNKQKLSMPVQITGYHQGGQIDVSEALLVTQFSSAIGLSFFYNTTNISWSKGLRFDPYLTLYKDFSPNSKRPFQNGRGAFLNFTWETRHFNIMMSYWNGYKFIASHGGAIYQSESSNYHNKGYTEKNRELLIVRFLQDIKILEHLYLTARFEPFYDFGNQKFEFSHGLYINYRPDFKLGALKPFKK